MGKHGKVQVAGRSFADRLQALALDQIAGQSHNGIIRRIHTEANALE